MAGAVKEGVCEWEGGQDRHAISLVSNGAAIEPLQAGAARATLFAT